MKQVSFINMRPDVPPRRRLSFERLSDAFKQYKCKSGLLLPAAQEATGSYEENRIILDKLQTGLRQALKDAVDTPSKATGNQLRDWAI